MQISPKCGIHKLSQENIELINAILASEQRVELIPTKNGVRVIRVRREEVKYRSPA